MSQFQGDYPPGMVPQYASGPYGQPARTSITAVLSLVFGILGCVPFATGLCAVVLGIFGISATRNPAVTGRGLAISGLVLGILSILLWGGLSGILIRAYAQTAPDRARARTFITDLSNGDIAAAKAMCTTSVSNAEIDSAAALMKQGGALQSVIVIGFNVTSTNGSTSTMIRGSAVVANGPPKKVEIRFVHSGGNSMIDDFRIR